MLFRLFPICLRFLALLLMAVSLVRPLWAQSDDALQVLPPARQVVQDMRGANDRDSAARATAALQVLEGLVSNLAGPRAASKQFTPAERAKLDEYSRAYGEIWSREYDSLPECEGDRCARYLYAQCAQGYYFRAPFYREIMDRYLPADWQARHLPRLQGKLWKDAAALPAGTRVPTSVGSSAPCVGAGQSLVAAVVPFWDRLSQQFFGPRARMDNPAYRAFLGQARIALGIGLALAALFLLGYLRQFGRRVSFDAADPLKLTAPSQLDLHLATGLVLGTSKGIQTTTTTYTQDNRVTGTSSTSVVHDQFFIHAPDGTETAVKLKGVDVAVRDGHVMTAAWTKPRGKDKKGQYLFLRNHSLKKSQLFDESERMLLGVRRRYLWLTFLTLLTLAIFLALSMDWWVKGGGAEAIATTLIPLSMFVFVVMGIVQWLSTRLRLRGLRRHIEEKMVPELDRRAANMLSAVAPSSITRAD